MSYTLYDVWNPIRTTIASEIKSAYDATTQTTLDSTHASKIEALCYNYCHVLLTCDMSFDDTETLASLQQMLKNIFKHKAYALCSEWNLMCSSQNIDTGKAIHQESFYDVADTPHIESKDWSELDVRIRQVETLYNHSQAIKELYNEIKCLVQCIY